jgi:hypothetical protein
MKHLILFVKQLGDLFFDLNLLRCMPAKPPDHQQTNSKPTTNRGLITTASHSAVPK